MKGLLKKTKTDKQKSCESKKEGITTPLRVEEEEVEEERGGRVRRDEDGGRGVHKPCLAREADTWSASVDSWGGSVMLMLPEDETVLSCCGESSSETISAPWSVRALADSRKLSLWLSICRGGRGHRDIQIQN